MRACYKHVWAIVFAVLAQCCFSQGVFACYCDFGVSYNFRMESVIQTHYSIVLCVYVILFVSILVFLLRIFRKKKYVIEQDNTSSFLSGGKSLVFFRGIALMSSVGVFAQYVNHCPPCPSATALANLGFGTYFTSPVVMSYIVYGITSLLFLLVYLLIRQIKLRLFLFFVFVTVLSMTWIGALRQSMSDDVYCKMRRGESLFEWVTECKLRAAIHNQKTFLDGEKMTTQLLIKENSFGGMNALHKNILLFVHYFFVVVLFLSSLHKVYLKKKKLVSAEDPDHMGEAKYSKTEKGILALFIVILIFAGPFIAFIGGDWLLNATSFLLPSRKFVYIYYFAIVLILVWVYSKYKKDNHFYAMVTKDIKGGLRMLGYILLIIGLCFLVIYGPTLLDFLTKG